MKKDDNSRPPGAHHYSVRRPDPIPPLKQQLAALLVQRLERWSGVWAGDLIGTDQPRMSDLRNNRLTRFSLERMIRFVHRIGGEVTIEVTWTRRRFAPPDQR